MELSVRQQNNSLQYDQNNKKWTQLNTQQIQNINKNKPNHQNLKIGTYNVLFGSPKTSFNFLLRNQTRFDHIIQKTIPQTDSDILGLCEVNQQFWDTLKQDEQIQKNYFISQENIVYKDKSHEVMMISKIPFISYFITDNSDNHMARYLLSLFFPENSEPFFVIQVHTFAYQERYSVRLRQMYTIDKYLKQIQYNVNRLEKNEKEFQKYISEAINGNNVIMMGDLNLHAPFETQFIDQTGFHDVWLEKYGINDPGYTWDPQQNKLIKLILPFDNRRMRLDRICLRKKSSGFKKVVDIQVQGKESIQNEKLLVGSDHYMLLAELELREKNKDKSQIEFYQPVFNFEQNQHFFDQKSTGFRSINQIIAIRVLTLPVTIIPYLFVIGVVKFT